MVSASFWTSIWGRFTSSPWLVIDIAPIHIDITGQTGPNQLLGNLLCALAGLLDNTPLALNQILQLLAQIKRLLG